jgi:hypothetical protein
MDDGSLLIFADRNEWREWLESHHQREPEAWIVLYKKGICERSLALDEAIVGEVAE